MKISTAGIELIKSFEGVKLEAYQDQVGVWTIGYGHTADVRPGSQITPAEARGLLEVDEGRVSEGVCRLVTRPINQNQFDALVCFSFNLGLGALKRSSLLSKVNAGDFKGAADEFLKWTKAGGKELPGLVRRRKAERELFLREES